MLLSNSLVFADPKMEDDYNVMIIIINEHGKENKDNWKVVNK